MHATSTGEKKTAGLETVYEQGMPLPWVNYPANHWPWLSFQEQADSQPHFCSCMRPAISAFLAWNEEHNTFRLPVGCLDKLPHFLSGPALQRSDLRLERRSEVETSPVFREACCHLCAGHMPSRGYPASGVLEAHFGWYVRVEGLKEGGELFSRDEGVWARGRRRVCVRLGLLDQERIDREDALAITVRGVFGIKEEILRNHRPSWLEGLELDLLLPQRRLGIEYQGAQHSEPVEFFGGERGLVVRLDNDERKARLCAEKGVALEYFDASDSLTEDHLRARLAAHLGRADCPAEWPPVKLRPEGPEWAALPPAQQLDTLLQIHLSEQMDYWASRPGFGVGPAARMVRALYVARYGESGPLRPGIEQASLLRKLYRYRKLGATRRWQDFCRYHSLGKARTEVLRLHGVSVDAAKALLRIRGGAEAWARAHGFPVLKIRAVLDPERRRIEGALGDRIADALARDLKAYRREKEDEIVRAKAIIRAEEKRIKLIVEQLAAVNADLVI